MHFQHTTAMPSGMTTFEPTGISIMSANDIIGVPQMISAGGNSGTTQTIIPGNVDDTLSVNLLQVMISWADLTVRGKFVIASKDSHPITIFQERLANTIILPCWDMPRYLGNHGLTIQDNSSGGEYAVVVNYIIREP